MKNINEEDMSEADSREFEIDMLVFIFMDCDKMSLEEAREKAVREYKEIHEIHESLKEHG
jgi:hypothetical protein